MTRSIHWRTDTLYVRDGQRSVSVALNDKRTEIMPEPETGAWQQCEWRDKQHLCRDGRSSLEEIPRQLEKPGVPGSERLRLHLLQQSQAGVETRRAVHGIA